MFVLGILIQISQIFVKSPPDMPVNPIRYAPVSFASSNALTTFFDVPLPLKAIITSSFLTKFFNCYLKISSYEVSLDHAVITGILSVRHSARNLF